MLKLQKLVSFFIIFLLFIMSVSFATDINMNLETR